MMLVQWEGLEGPEDPVAQDWKAGAASADDSAVVLGAVDMIEASSDQGRGTPRGKTENQGWILVPS